MADKITLPGQLQHSNPNFSIIDINDVRGGIKSVEVFDNPSLQNLLTGGIDKFLLDHTIILERSSNSFFWLSGATPSDVNSWNSISIEQDNRFRYIKTDFMVGGRGVQPSEHERIIGELIQEYINNNTFTITDTELVIFVFTIYEYGLFLAHDRKYTFPNMLGKGVYDIDNNIQYSDLELIYKSGSGTNLNLEDSVNNVVINLGDLGESGSAITTLVNYINSYGVYDFEDNTKIYYFKFIIGEIEYIYYFEGIDSVNGYVTYGGIVNFYEADLTLFYSSDMSLVTPDYNQDNRFRFIDFLVTIKGRKEAPTISNIQDILRSRVNLALSNRSIQVYDTELIVFKFDIIDTRVGGSYKWKYFFKNMAGKGSYDPIYPTISFDDLEICNQDLIIYPSSLDDIQSDSYNHIWDFDIMDPLYMTIDDIKEIMDPAIMNTYLNYSGQLLNMSDINKIYFFRFVFEDNEYIYYYSGTSLGTFGSEQLLYSGGDLVFFSNNTLYSNIPVSLNNNIPRTHRILSTDINKRLLDITEQDIVSYVNSRPDYIKVDEYDSLMIFDVYQPSIDIEFGDVNNTGVIDKYSRYSWDEWINRSNEDSNHALRIDNRKFEFSDSIVSDNNVSLIGDLDDLFSFSLNSYSGYTFSKVSFGKSKIKKINIGSNIPITLDISRLYGLNNIELNTTLSRLNITSKYIDTLYISRTIGQFIFPIQATMSVAASYYFSSGVIQESDVMLMLENLVQSPTSNVGYFAIEDYYYLGGVSSSSEVTTLVSRGWVFTDPLVVVVPPPLGTTTVPPPS